MPDSIEANLEPVEMAKVGPAAGRTEGWRVGRGKWFRRSVGGWGRGSSGGTSSIGRHRGDGGLWTCQIDELRRSLAGQWMAFGLAIRKSSGVVLHGASTVVQFRHTAKRAWRLCEATSTKPTFATLFYKIASLGYNEVRGQQKGATATGRERPDIRAY
jgi:hypothetical protein